jgi:hypothetical protein
MRYRYFALVVVASTIHVWVVLLVKAYQDMVYVYMHVRCLTPRKSDKRLCSLCYIWRHREDR